MTADLHSKFGRAAWPRDGVTEIHSAFSPLSYPSPLSGMLVPDAVPEPPPPARARERAELMVAIAGAALAAFFLAGVALAAFARAHGWFG